MRYVMLVYGEESCWTETERNECIVESMSLCDRLAKQGKFLTSSPLESSAKSSVVRAKQGKPLVTAGPFAETTEQLGGFYLLELEDLDEAITVASQIPPAAKGTIEIRPVFELDGLPSESLDLMHQHDPNLKTFMLICHDDEKTWLALGEAVHRSAMNQAVALTHELAKQNRYISAAPLHPTSTATSVRVRNGERLITDGPYAETREVLGGYYLILAGDQAEAEQIATRHPGLQHGCVEVRPLTELSKFRV